MYIFSDSTLINIIVNFINCLFHIRGFTMDFYEYHKYVRESNIKRGAEENEIII